MASLPYPLYYEDSRSRKRRNNLPVCKEQSLQKDVEAQQTVYSLTITLPNYGHAPRVQNRIPDLATAARVTGHTISVARNELVPDEVERVEVLGKDEHAMSLRDHRSKPLLKGLELTVHRNLTERSNVVLQVEPFGFQFISPVRIMIQPYEMLALLVEDGGDFRIKILVLFFLRYFPLQITPRVRIRESLLNGRDQIPPPFQAPLERRKTTREPFAEDRHQKSHTTTLFLWEVGEPIEVAAQVIDPVVQLSFCIG
jgi:hypothetical protein